MTDSQTITGVTADSREVKPGFLFVAVAGHSQDGHDYLLSAQEKGATRAIGEKSPPAGLKIPYQRVNNSRLALAEAAAEFYGNPSHAMLMIGVTGTSGKTTTTYLLESILEAAGHAVGVIGTVNFRFQRQVIPSTHTTPGPVELQKLLAEMKLRKCTAIVMEVSSHALEQNRADHIAFDGMLFTNLSPEHLDFHASMDEYFHAKRRLFTDLAHYAKSVGKMPAFAINEADAYGKKLLGEVGGQAFGRDAGFKLTLSGIQGALDGHHFQSPLTGEFNVANISGAATLALSLGISPDQVAKGLSALSGVPGRLEKVAPEQGRHVFVDYAHKPDALEKVLRSLGAIKGPHRLITVFGCGGDRDRQKRPQMGKLAAELSDLVIVTSDNPRTEDPAEIIREITRGIPASLKHFEVEPDREKAIFRAIQRSKPGDLVLIAGKGHEDYQILSDGKGKTKKIPFDDRDVATRALKQVT